MGRACVWTILFGVTVLPFLAAHSSVIVSRWSTGVEVGTSNQEENRSDALSEPAALTDSIPGSPVAPLASPSLPAVEPVTAADTGTPSNRVLAELARDRLAEARVRFQNGVLSQLELKSFERDLTLAEAAGDPLGMARARRDFSDHEVREARQRVTVGALDSLSLRSIETTNVLLGLGYVDACVAARRDEGTRATNAVRVEAARARWADLQQQAAVGQVAPEGREIVAARNELESLEALVTADAPGLARVFRDASARWLKLIEILHRVGKATPAELAEARQAADRDERVLVALQPQ